MQFKNLKSSLVGSGSGRERVWSNYNSVEYESFSSENVVFWMPMEPFVQPFSQRCLDQNGTITMQLFGVFEHET